MCVCSVCSCVCQNCVNPSYQDTFSPRGVGVIEGVDILQALHRGGKILGIPWQSLENFRSCAKDSMILVL